MFDDTKILVFDDWRAALVGIVVATLWSMILSGIRNVRKQGRLALTRSIWKPLLKNKYEITVVLTKKPSDTPGGTSKVSLSEVEAFSALQATLNPLKLSPILSHNPNILLKDIPGHVISIGGPKANNVTQEILELVAHRHPTMPTYDAQRKCIVAGAQAYETQYAQNMTLIKDYGLVIRATGLQSNSNICFFLAFALRGRSTWGSVKTITLAEDLKKSIDDKVADDDFVLVLEFEYKSNEIIRTKIISLQQFNKI